MEVNSYLKIKSEINKEYDKMKDNKLSYPYNFCEGYLAGIDILEQVIDKIYQEENINPKEFTD